MPIPKSPERHPKRFKKPNSKQKTAIQHVLTSRGENDMIDETRHRDESRSARSVKDRDEKTETTNPDIETETTNPDIETETTNPDIETETTNPDIETETTNPE